MKLHAFHSLAPLVVAALVLPLALSPSQEPEQEPEDGPIETPIEEVPLTPDGQFFGAEAPGKDDVALNKRMVGLWKATEVVSEDWPKEGLDLLGFLHISEHFMSMELQAYWDDTLEDAPDDAFETFTAEYRFDKSGRVDARVLVGSFIDPETGRLEWYQSASPKQFTVKVLGTDSLLLEWSDIRSMTFQRQHHSEKSTRDFFGGISPDRAELNDFYNDNDLFEDDEFDKPEDEPEVTDDDE